ncbi:MAG TPA: EAL domain-containing protein [Pyrinomonadaceae bacterium]|jgi:diguanylate cyclase (GGDEF)-like protein|nr:EAL domain-containing protein [Pyrinomonadaceae bacterium]
MPQKYKPSILIIDDEQPVRLLLVALLSDDYLCLEAGSAEEALAVLEERTFDLVLSDINMSGITGLELVPRIHERAPDTVVVMISGQHDIDSAIQSMRAGAFDYITKPLELRQVQSAVARALEHRTLLADKRRYEIHLEELVQERAARIEHLAYHDRLTDLPNRTLFEQGAESWLTSQPSSGAVLVVSLDRFKKIMGTLGHAAGDDLLVAAAQRLSACLEAGEVLAKFDAQEFAFLIGSIEDREAAAKRATAIADAMRPPFLIADSQEIFVTTSIGISVFPANGNDVASLLRNARAALDRAKNKGGNNHQFYASEMNEQAVSNLGLETNLRRAVEENELITFYQPIFELATGRAVAFEALVRWQHPRLGLLRPADFIGLAEDTGLIIEIGALVMRRACSELRSWQRMGRGQLRVAVNICARQILETNFTDQLISTLAESQLDPQSLEIEITETSIMEHSEVAIRMLNDIRRLGVRVSVDDFGTGYSSLSYLKHLPIDTVKLDRSFVSGATSDPRDAALVMAVVTLAHNLNLRVIAEGIETEEQLQFLRLLRCDEGQGNLLGQPAEPENLNWAALTGWRKQNVVANPWSPAVSLTVNQ